MKLKIWQVGESVLRRKSRPLAPEEITTPAVRGLIQSMLDTMRDAPGVGLAAPQVGLDLQIAVIEDRPEYLQKLTPQQIEERQRRPVPFHVLINPQLTIQTDATVEFFEGCLSLSGFTGIVPRATAVQVDYLDQDAQPQTIAAEGWYARILQHEIDHLDGTLYIDRMDPRSFCSLENYLRHWKDCSVEEFRSRIR